MNIKPFLNPKDNSPPQDGTWLLLLVEIIDDDDWFPTEDSKFFRTIGFNDRDANGDDTWRVMGWDWCHDHILETTGKIIGWMSMPSMPADLIVNEGNDE